MKCLECRAEIGSARICQRCSAPVLESPGDSPAPLPAAREAAKSSMSPLAWIGIALLNLLALYYAAASIVVGIVYGSPSQWGANNLPLWAVAAIGFTGAMVPACTVVIVVRRRRRRVREQTMARNSPQLPLESLD